MLHFDRDRSVSTAEATDSLDDLNEQLLRATWELDFLARAASIEDSDGWAGAQG
jgi:hypothetical protein